MLEQSQYDFLVISDVPLILSFLFFVLDCELVDFFLFLVKNFILLRVFVLCCLRSASDLTRNLFDVLLVGLNHFAHIGNFFLLLLYLSVVLLDSIH